MTELAVRLPNLGESAKPYQNFSIEDMHSFYTARQFLQYEDGTKILDKCIAKKEEILHYQNTLHAVHGTFYINGGLLGMIERDRSYQYDYTVEKKVWISTQMLMDKLDASLYFWRELNPELVRLLSAQPLIELEVVSNWMIHYLSPFLATANANDVS